VFDRSSADILPAEVDSRYGFTCATFVLAMLRSTVAEELLALDQWPIPDPDDADDLWQRRMAKFLCRDNPEDANAVLAGLGARRFLPTDVAGAAMLSSEHWPVRFEAARREGDQIAGRLLLE
jgi:hypothetical protein